MKHGQGEIYPQEVINGGKGAKAPNNDALIEEHSKSVGSAKPAEKNSGNYCNTPDGQRVF